MSLSYDVFGAAFLSKIAEYDFLRMADDQRTSIVDSYMKRAIASFNKICQYNFIGVANDDVREYDIEIDEADLDELVDIVSEGMVVQWMKPYVYHQENLQNVLNTRDFTTYSPAELLLRIGNAYSKAQKDYTQMIREYSYNHGDLTTLHL